jgi:DNA helicase-2/ATP-dependent DNA helicase PcrA
MTIHNSKGLEFPVVFLTGLEEGLFPSHFSIKYGDINSLEEERRLFYVGVTRAENLLYITRALIRMKMGRTDYSIPSRFLAELPGEFIESVQNQFAKPPLKPIKSKIRDEGRRENISSISLKINSPADVKIDFIEGDEVSHPKYGKGKVVSISPAGKDYEVLMLFPDIGRKRFMAALSGLKKDNID